MGYVFTRPVRLVERDERGRVTKRVRFGKGESPKGFSDERVEAFKRTGTLKEEAEVASEEPTPEPSVGPAARSGQTVAEDQGDPDEPVGEGNDATDEGGGDETVEDEYSDMTVAELQDEAESRDLSKSGNKADLQARLREDDASE